MSNVNIIFEENRVRNRITSRRRQLWVEETANCIAADDLHDNSKNGCNRADCMSSGSRVAAALAENNFEFAAPVFVHRDQLPFDFGREVAQDRLVGGVNSQSGSGEQ